MNGLGGPRLRFAPSPTGSLHLGNARTALFNWLVARRGGGTLILRIEDTDTERHRAGSEAAILEDLAWLGLDWDEGPDRGGPCGPYRQSERATLYRDRARRLLDGGQAYPCFCSEAELHAERERARAERRPPRYSGRCRERIATAEPHAVRFRIPAGPEPVRFTDRLRGPIEFAREELGDPVILRRDGRPTYNFAAAVDDSEMRVNLVLRGDDHLSNTPRQLLLYEALGQPRPEFAHLPMVTGPDGRRLSKRHGALSVSEYRRRGFPAHGLLNALVLLGWAPDGERTSLSREEMLAEFDLDRVGRSAAGFDPERLAWLSGRVLRDLPAADLAREVGARLVASDDLPAGALERDPEWVSSLAEMLRTDLSHFEQVPERARQLFAPGGEPSAPEGREALAGEGAAGVVEALARLAAGDPPLDREGWRRICNQLQESTGMRGKRLYHPIRVALTGEPSGPELDRLVPLIERGHRLCPDRIPSVSERASRTAGWMK